MGGHPQHVCSRVGGRGRHRALRCHGVAVRARRRVRALPDLQQRTLALRTAPRSHRSRLPAHVRRPYARSKDAAVMRVRKACLLVCEVGAFGASLGRPGRDGEIRARPPRTHDEDDVLAAGGQLGLDAGLVLLRRPYKHSAANPPTKAVHRRTRRVSGHVLGASSSAGATSKLNIIPLSWCSAMWQCAIHTTDVGDVEQDVDGLAGAHQHRVLPHQVGLGRRRRGRARGSGRRRGRGTGGASDGRRPSRSAAGSSPGPRPGTASRSRRSPHRSRGRSASSACSPASSAG